MRAFYLGSETMRYLLVHPEYGIYLGNCLGLGFWSKVDPVGQPAAVTFQTEADAEAHMDDWGTPRPEGYYLHPIDTEQDYAIVTQCILAGLDGWIDEQTSHVGPMQ